MPFITRPLNAETLDSITSLYKAFSKVAQSDYAWPGPPGSMVPFDMFKAICEQGIFQGYVCVDEISNEAVGFFVIESTNYGVIEPKICYFKPEIAIKSAIACIFEQFLADLNTNLHWKTLSFSLLGPVLREYVQYLPWYGFTPVGQAVVEFNLQDSMTAEVYKSLNIKPLPEGMSLVPWSDTYRDAVLPLIFEAFEQSVDAKWDPRFWQLETISDVVDFVVQGEYGEFYGAQSQILLDAEQKPIGFCFLSQLSPMEANIPLVGIAKAHRGNALAHTMLAALLKSVVHGVVNQKLYVHSVTATVATDNYPALKLYRSLGFVEKYWYPHVYLTREQLMAHLEKPRC